MITNNLYVIAAICGNWWQESGLNPGIWEGTVVGNPGYGLGQWTDVAGVVSRRTDLFNYLSSMGLAMDDGDGQCDFLLYENLWLTIGPGGRTSQYQYLMDFITSTSTNLSDLVYEFMWFWEGIDDGTGPTRLNYAQQCLSLFQLDTGARAPWASGNRYLSPSESQSNSLLIKDFFLEESPTPPEPPEPEPEPLDDDMIALLNEARKRNKKGGIFILW